MSVPARGMELERRFTERPARAKTVGKPARIGVARHPGGHALLAFEDLPRAGEPFAREVRRHEPVRCGFRRVELLRVRGVAQEFPQARRHRPRGPEAILHLACVEAEHVPELVGHDDRLARPRAGLTVCGGAVDAELPAIEAVAS